MTKKEISKGPGKYALMKALFEGEPIVFTQEDGLRLKVNVTTIQREDGSNQSWNISGWIKDSNERFHCYYTTKGNRGTITNHSVVLTA